VSYIKLDLEITNDLILHNLGMLSGLNRISILGFHLNRNQPLNFDFEHTVFSLTSAFIQPPSFTK
jgi:hypothetical protein